MWLAATSLALAASLPSPTAESQLNTVGVTGMRIPQPIRKILRRLTTVRQIRLAVKRTRRTWPGENSRFAYQQQFFKFDISKDDLVLDIGSGADPFPFASIL